MGNVSLICSWPSILITTNFCIAACIVLGLSWPNCSRISMDWYLSVSIIVNYVENPKTRNGSDNVSKILNFVTFVCPRSCMLGTNWRKANSSLTTAVSAVSVKEEHYFLRHSSQ